MPTISELEVMTDRLYVYDVDQKGWEQTPNGLTANVMHVGYHLDDTLDRKDFLDPGIAQSDIAPDALQYALRLGYWTSLPVQQLQSNPDWLTLTAMSMPRYEGVPIAATAFQKARATLSKNLHDADHATLRAEALQQQRPSIAIAAGLLLFAANDLAERYEFNLVDAFDDRLASLRVRFDIPEPQE